MPLYNYFNRSAFLELEQKAKNSPRKRAHLNLHQSHNDAIQKTAISLIKGTYIPPHYHRHEHQKELMLVLSGTVKAVFFNEDGSISDILILNDGEIAEVLPFSIHTLVCMTDNALILEIKSGPFIADDCKESLDWTIPEGSDNSKEYLKWLETAEINIEMPSYFLK